ncbi:MAG: hypothetical protein JNL94_03360, partial [Planctomycetes bacterium]|nr:hypothetical protein [Planctomycetota bacterium]
MDPQTQHAVVRQFDRARRVRPQPRDDQREAVAARILDRESAAPRRVEPGAQLADRRVDVPTVVARDARETALDRPREVGAEHAGANDSGRLQRQFERQVVCDADIRGPHDVEIEPERSATGTRFDPKRPGQIRFVGGVEREAADLDARPQRTGALDDDRARRSALAAGVAERRRRHDAHR